MSSFTGVSVRTTDVWRWNEMMMEKNMPVGMERKLGEDKMKTEMNSRNLNVGRVVSFILESYTQ